MVIKRKKSGGPPDIVVIVMLIVLFGAMGFVFFQSMGPTPEYKEDYNPTSVIDSMSVDSTTTMDTGMNE